MTGSNSITRPIRLPHHLWPLPRLKEKREVERRERGGGEEGKRELEKERVRVRLINYIGSDLFDYGSSKMRPNLD